MPHAHHAPGSEQEETPIMMHIGDTPAEQASADQQDAAVREAMAAPYGGMWNANMGFGLPYLDESGRVGVVHIDSPDSDNRLCTACLTGARADGGPCAGPCRRPADLRVHYGNHQCNGYGYGYGYTEAACDDDVPDLLANLRVLVMDSQHALG